MSRGLLRAMMRPYAEIDFTRMALDSRVAFARSSDAWRWNAAGLLVQEASNAWRKEHDPLTGEVLGLLVEEQRTNLFVRSEEANSTSWTKTAASVSADVAVSPSGTNTMDKIVEDTTTGGHGIRQSVGSLAELTTYRASFFMRAAGRVRSAAWSFAGGDTGASIFNSSTEAAGGVNNPAIQRVGAGLYRCAFDVVTIAGQVSRTVHIGAQDPVNNAQSYLGDGSSGIYVSGMQLELGAFPTSPIPTTTAAVTRAADYATVTDLSTLRFNAAAGALSVTARAPIYLARAATLLSYNDNTTGNVIRFRMESGGALKAEVIAGGVTQASLTLGTLTAGAQFSAAMSYAANDIRGCLNGGTVQSDASASIPTVNRLMIGRGASGEWWNSTILRHRYWPRALSNEELQRASA